MSAPAAIKGSFADFRLVKGRKVAVISVELPIEQADEALRILGGVPQPHAERWVALARLNETPAADPAGEEDVSRSSPAASTPMRDKPASVQAGILCNDQRFRSFLRERGHPIDTQFAPAEWAADAVRKECGCEESRRELDSDHRKRALWHALETDFRVWSGQMAAPR